MRMKHPHGVGVWAPEEWGVSVSFGARKDLAMIANALRAPPLSSLSDGASLRCLHQRLQSTFAGELT